MGKPLPGLGDINRVQINAHHPGPGSVRHIIGHRAIPAADIQNPLVRVNPVDKKIMIPGEAMLDVNAVVVPDRFLVDIIG